MTDLATFHAEAASTWPPARPLSITRPAASVRSCTLAALFSAVEVTPILGRQPNGPCTCRVSSKQNNLLVTPTPPTSKPRRRLCTQKGSSLVDFRGSEPNPLFTFCGRHLSQLSAANCQSKRAGARVIGGWAWPPSVTLAVIGRPSKNAGLQFGEILATKVADEFFVSADICRKVWTVGNPEKSPG